MKMIKIVSALVIFLALAGYAAFEIFFRLPIPAYEGRILLPGLTAAVTVRSDAYGVPHIFAENEADLFFAQGYVTARERMFQMEITRLAGRGELSSLFGEAALEKDRFLKTVGFHRRAAVGYREMPADARRILDAYAAGVNAYLQTAGHLPREYVLLRYKPRPWTPEDSVATAMLMSYSLTRSKKVDLVMNHVLEKAGDDIYRLFKPSYPDFAPILADRALASAVTRPAEAPSGAASAFAAVAALVDPFAAPLDFPASNWMIFSGRLTDTGKPYFTGSPDLKPTLPALFYLTRLKGGGFDVIGGSLPGVPCIGPLGFNGRLAWSAVNGRGDELDYFVEKVNPDNPDQYLTENGWRDFETVQEVISIKGKKGLREEPLTVRISRHGPIISDVLPGAPKNCAMQWTALDLPGLDIAGLIGINRAADFAEFQNACRMIRTMNLNLGFADIEGNIGWHFTGAPPIRKKGDGSLPVPGWAGEYDWTGFIPPERMACDLNPERGYVASFNNEPGNVDYHMTHYYLFERAMRFAEIMKRRADGPVTLEEARAIQLDSVDIVAERWVPLILAACRDREDLKKYTALFQGWNCAATVDSPAATLFNAFYLRFMQNSFRDEVGPEAWQELSESYIYYVPDLLMTRIRDRADHPIFDDVATRDRRETRDDIIVRSMAETTSELSARLGGDFENWRWGKVHQMDFEHPLGSKLKFFNLKPVPTNGTHHTINSGFWDAADPFKMNAGGVIRMVVDFARVENCTIISPPGQSGHLRSPFYDDLAQMWAEGVQIPMHFNNPETLPHVLTLAPGES